VAVQSALSELRDQPWHAYNPWRWKRLQYSNGSYH